MGDSVRSSDERQRPIQRIVTRYDLALATAPRAILATLALSILISLAASLVVGIPEAASVLDDDEQEYWALATDLVSGDYEFQSRRVLGFPLFLAGLQRLGLGVFGAHIVLALLFALTAPLVTAMLISRFQLRPSRAAAIGMAVAVWPPFAFYGSSMYSETLALPLLALLLLALVPGVRTPGAPALTKRWWLQDIIVGVLLGLSMYVRPVFALYAPLLLLTVLLENRFVTGLKRATIIAVFAAIVFSPWMVSVSVHYGSFVPLSTNGGETLAGGLNPVILEMGNQEEVMPDGRTTWVGPGKWIGSNLTGYLEHGELELPYALQRDTLLRERTLDWVAAHPGAAAYLSARKVAYMWGFYPIWNGMTQTLVGQVPTLLLLLAVLVLFVRNWAFGLRLPRFWLLPVFVTLVALISWGSWRFRMPGDLGLLILGGMLVFAGIDRRGGSHSSKSNRTLPHRDA